MLNAIIITALKLEDVKASISEVEERLSEVSRMEFPIAPEDSRKAYRRPLLNKLNKLRQQEWDLEELSLHGFSCMECYDDIGPHRHCRECGDTLSLDAKKCQNCWDEKEAARRKAGIKMLTGLIKDYRARTGGSEEGG